MTVNGVLNLYKPAGETSMDMVRMIKRLTGQKKVGHGGTLDPIASGVLPICFGQATRLMDPLVDGVKRYHTRVRLGETTDTYDADGTITATADASGVTGEAVEEALASASAASSSRCRPCTAPSSRAASASTTSPAPAST